MKKNNISKLIYRSKSSAGFTLIELIMASVLGVIVIGVAGFGLNQVLRASRDGNAAAERRSEVARAYDFISDEIRKAELIEPDATNADGYTVTLGENVVLALKLPEIDNEELLDSDNNDTNEARVIYYVSTPPANSVWRGPRVLYRWGPPLDANGDYSPRASASDPSNWVKQPLLDEIAGNSITLSCETGWIASAAAGFGACISPNNKTAQLYIDGNIAQALGDSDIYSSNTKTFARSNQATAITNLSLLDPSSALGGQFDGNGPAPGNTEVNTQIVLPTETINLAKGASTSTTIPGGQTITITSEPQNPGTCVSASNCQPVSIDFEIDANTNKIKDLPDDADQLNGYDKIKIFHNGSTVPNVNAHQGQKTIYQFLKDKGVEFVETAPDLTEYTIKMNPNQVLLAFEIGQDSDTLLSGDPNPGYDHQDNLVVITSEDLNYSN